MNKGAIAFIIILVFILGLVLGVLFVSVSLSSNSYRVHTVRINDFVNIKVYTNSYYDLYKLKRYISNMENFVYTNDNMIILTKTIHDRFISVANIRFYKFDGTYYDTWGRYTKNVSEE